MSAQPSVPQPPARTVDDAVAAVASAVAAALSTDWDIDGGGWQMAPDALAFLDALIDTLKPQHVVEFGGGTSTAVLTAASKRNGRSVHITSIDNDPQARDATLQLLDATDDTGAVTVDVAFAPLVVRRIDGRHLPVYLLDPAALAQRQAPDLIIVDGPPSHLGGREGALRQAVALASVATIVVLDDADRDDERDTFDAVIATHHNDLQRIECEGFARGLAMFVVTAPTNVTFTNDGPQSFDDTDSSDTDSSDTDGSDTDGSDPAVTV